MSAGPEQREELMRLHQERETALLEKYPDARPHLEATAQAMIDFLEVITEQDAEIARLKAARESAEKALLSLADGYERGMSGLWPHEKTAIAAARSRRMAAT